MSEYTDMIDDMWLDVGGYYITLTRGDDTTSLIKALITKTTLNLVDSFDVQQLSQVVDITIKSTDLQINDVVLFPTKTDSITFVEGTITYTYKLFADFSPSYLDSKHDTMKIHAHEISAVDSSTAIYDEYGEFVYNPEGESLYNDFGELIED